jgi:hypothetical protein
VPNPPHIGQILEFRVKVEVTGASKKRRTDGEMRYTRSLQILSVARAGEDLPPDANDNQPEMFDDDGQPTDMATGGDPETLGDAMGTVVDFPDQGNLGDEDAPGEEG